MSDYLPDLRQGDEYTLCIDMSNDGVNPVDLTGYKAWFTLKADLSDGDSQAALQFSCVAGSEESDKPEQGLMYMVIPSSIMRNVMPGIYLYDLQIKRPGAVGEGIKTLLPPWDNPLDMIQVLGQVTQAVA
jgi:hypothetical protein